MIFICAYKKLKYVIDMGVLIKYESTIEKLVISPDYVCDVQYFVPKSYVYGRNNDPIPFFKVIAKYNNMYLCIDVNDMLQAKPIDSLILSVLEKNLDILDEI